MTNLHPARQPELQNGSKPTYSERFAYRGTILFLILVLAAGLRFYHLGSLPYWFDESFSVRMAQFSLQEIWHRCARDTHPPFYFWCLKGWSGCFGASPAVTRACSAILGSLTVLGTFLFVRDSIRLSNRGEQLIEKNSDFTAGVLSALLVALSPMQITWSMQARMYALGCFLSVYSSWFLIRALLVKEYQPVTWCLYCCSAAMLLYTHHFGVFTVGAQFVFTFLIVARRSENPVKIPFRNVSFSCISIMVIWSLWIPNLISQRATVADGFWTRPVSWDAFGAVFAELFCAGQRPFQIAQHSPAIGWVLIQILVLCLLVLVLKSRPAFFLVSLLTVFPFTCAVLISLVSQSVIVARYFQFAQLFVFGSVAIAVNQIPIRSLRWFCALGILLSAASESAHQHRNRLQTANQSGTRQAVQEFETSFDDGEILIVCHPQIYLSVLHEIRKDIPIGSVRPVRFPGFSDGAPVMTHQDYIEPNVSDMPHAVWTLIAHQFKERQWPVQLPGKWREVHRITFKDYYYGTLSFRLHVNEST